MLGSEGVYGYLRLATRQRRGRVIYFRDDFLVTRPAEFIDTRNQELRARVDGTFSLCGSAVAGSVGLGGEKVWWFAGEELGSRNSEDGGWLR